MVSSTPIALSVDELEVGATSTPFGTAWLPGPGLGVDLGPTRYVERELLVRGRGGRWAYDAAWEPELLDEHPFTTRVLVRCPADPSRSSGLVLLEPLHPDLDNAPTWRAAADWMLRSGHTWVGVTQSAAVARDIAARLPRYAPLSIPPVGIGLGLDIVGQVAVAVRGGAFDLGTVDRIVMSGWSITGSFCRIYLQDGFLARHRTDSGPAVDGVLIGKSSGAFDPSGYPPLSTGAPTLPARHPRRTVRGTVPTMEVLSETEGETHGPVLREDSDEPGDRYRLYQLAGTSHHELGLETRLTNAHQYAKTGGELADARINEIPSDARFEIFVGALLDQLDRWLRAESVPPRAPRFDYRPDARGTPSSLDRDGAGTVVGGIRPPWTSVPTALYRPTSTPAPGAFRPVARFPATGTPEQAASMVGHRIPFAPEELDRRYGSAAEYRRRLRTAVGELVSSGYVLPEDGDSYLAQAEYPGAA